MLTSSIIAAGLYLGKSILISGLLYGYYRVFLRNKRFHGYNRCYLLSIPLISCLFPLIDVSLDTPLGTIGDHWWMTGPARSTIGALHNITGGHWEESVIGDPYPRFGPLKILLTLQGLAYGVYLLISGALLCIFLRQLIYVLRLPGKYRRVEINDAGRGVGECCFFLTREPGAPFSFLRNMFWDEQLEFDSARGKQVFSHELYHIRQKHSLDLLLLKPVMILFWVNPFFYLVYREIKAIHEFMADRYAISCDSGGDRYQYAELLVWQMIARPRSSLLHPFFHSPIKRRITMITQLKTTRPGLLVRLMALPLLILLFCAFATRLAPQHLAPRHPLQNPEQYPADVIPLRSPVTVIIDAGHGGIDPGAVNKDGIQEKNIDLAIAQKIKQFSAEYNVNVLMTREQDELAGGKSSIKESLRYRTDMANKNKADLFVSIHTDAAGGDNVTGFNIYVSSGNRNYPKCLQFGSAMIDALKGNTTIGNDLKQRDEGIWVLRRSDMPAILLLCGNIDDAKDLAFVSNNQNQEKIARDILQGIVGYENSVQDAKQ